MTAYTTIPDSETTAFTGATPAVVQQQTGSVWKLTAVLSTVALGVVAVLYSHGGGADAGVLTASIRREPIPKSPKVKACSFDECYATNCNGAVAPYTCLFHNGGPHGGCSPTPWIPGTCTVQCDLSECSSLEIPDSTASCADVECTADWCKDGQLCPTDVPFQCTSGSARFGCSTDKLTWTLKTDGSTCNACCDTTTC